MLEEGGKDPSAEIDAPEEDSVRPTEAEEKELEREEDERTEPEIPEVDSEEKESLDVDMREAARSEVVREEQDIVLSTEVPVFESAEGTVGVLWLFSTQLWIEFFSAVECIVEATVLQTVLPETTVLCVSVRDWVRPE